MILRVSASFREHPIDSFSTTNSSSRILLNVPRNSW